jgi:FkbM family methyltransferase
MTEMEPATTYAAREWFLERAEELTPFIAVDTDEGRYLLSTFDRHITRSLLLKSSRGEMKILRRALAVLDAVGCPVRATTFLDVGANIGTTTIPALRIHGFVRAVACEPEPRNLLLLELNLVANDLERDVEICRAAIGEVDGDVELLVAERRSGLHEVHAGEATLPPWADASQRTTVRLFALDTLVSRGLFDPKDVGILWMDTQGHEGHILRGATTLTRLGVPVVLELGPAALERHGGLEYVLETARADYTHFVIMRRIRRRAGQVHFDLNPIERLDDEIDWLSRAARFTDVLLLRDPRSRPAAPGPPRPPAQPTESGATVPQQTHLPLREPGQIPAVEREEFLRQARTLTPLLATEVDGATFIARTAADADELSLFVNRVHPNIQLLGRGIAALTELGLAEECRTKTFVQAQSGVGIATVAALCWSGFARGLACEPDLSTYRVLKLNMKVNGLTARVRTLPVALDGASSDGEAESFDSLISRGVIDAGDAGLIWITDGDVAATLTGATDGLLRGPPLLLRFGPKDGPELVELLRKTHTHFVSIDGPSARRHAVPLGDRVPEGEILALRLP